ncbi:MAG: DsbA family oxidoreductase [Cyanobacteria bacterium P01_G01_bin.4]
MTSTPLKKINPIILEITSDFICPWCFVAETRLKQAISQFQLESEIQLIWRPFELNPDMPDLGIDRKAYRSQKFGSWTYSQQLDAKTIQATLDDDIQFRYDLMNVTPNTLKAHRLTMYAAEQQRATEMAERILRAYFSEGQNISDAEILSDLASDVGMEKEQVRDYLLSGGGIQEVRELERKAATSGIRGVPSIRVGTNLISGAQSVATYRTAIQQLMEAES